MTTKECHAAFAVLVKEDLIIGRRADKQEKAQAGTEEENVPVAETEMKLGM